MECEFNYCIYNEDLTCSLDKIQIDALGQCTECIIISLTEDELKKYKKDQQKRQ